MNDDLNDLFSRNLANISHEFDLFGHKIEKLSMKDRIGFFPISVWQAEPMIVKKLKELIGDGGAGREHCFQPADPGGKRIYDLEESIFNPHLAQMILSAYCPPAARIYDPFAGGGTRGFIATAMGHDYYGVELRREECLRVEAQQAKLGQFFTLKCDDSQRHQPPGPFDFCYSCPPYYNLEIYSQEALDLSAAPSFAAFMAGMTLTLGHCFAALKPGALCVMVIGNFRQKNGSLTHFNGALTQAAQAIGFQLHDELIFFRNIANSYLRSGSFAAHRKSVRVHEYILIFKKDD